MAIKYYENLTEVPDDIYLLIHRGYLDLLESGAHETSRGLVSVEQEVLAAGNKAVCTFSEVPANAGKGNSIWVYLLYVDKDSRRKGLAKSLIRKLEKIALDRDTNYVELSTGINDEARGFYEAIGGEAVYISYRFGVV